jgi:hypothetical protein
MDSETEEESDNDVVHKNVEIIKVDDEYEVNNRQFGLKRDIILKLTKPMNREYELRNLFNIGKEIAVI